MSAEGSTAQADVPASAAERLMQEHAAAEAHKVTVCWLPLSPEARACSNAGHTPQG
jgi:hypothetical protein